MALLALAPYQGRPLDFSQRGGSENFERIQIFQEFGTTLKKKDQNSRKKEQNS